MSETTETRYPEHEKLSAVAKESQAIGEFLDFGLQRQGIFLAERDEHGRAWPTHKTIEAILATHFEIDRDRLDAEKREMFDQIREANAST